MIFAKVLKRVKKSNIQCAFVIRCKGICFVSPNMVSCGCGSCGSSLASLEVFSPAHILRIVQTTALRHSDFSFFSFSIFLCSGIKNLFLSIPSILSYVLFWSLSCPSFSSFLPFVLFPDLFSPSLFIHFIFWSPFFSDLLSFLFFSLFLLVYSVCFSLCSIIFDLFSFC